ncbi:hypothetical protein IWW45_005101 [Coemansia sp. RSA 485]|nr:hypothetical protein IWW45_005101 [Coemansia sp. RSA 485]
MFFDYDTRSVDANYEYVFGECPQLERLMSRFSSRVMRNMPNIVGIKHKSHRNDNVGKIFSNKLVNFFATQLRRVECYPEVKFVAPRFADNLEYIHIYSDPSSNTLLPEINPRSLRKMVLSDLSSSFSWKYFRDDENSNKVSFMNLDCLELSFNRIMDDIEAIASRMESIRLGGSEYFNVVLPKLKHMYINGNPVMPEMITSINLPSHMETVTVAETLENLSLCAELNTSSINHLKATLNVDCFDSQETFYRVTNSMFGKASICNKVSLELRNIPFELDVERIDWGKVTELTVGNPITYPQLTRLLPRMTSLQELVVSQFSCNGIEKEMFTVDIESQVKQSLKSLSNSLQSVWFLNIADDGPYDLAALCVQHLLPQLPALLNIKSFYCQAEALEDFAYDYQDYFPHLAYLNIID